MTEEEAVGAVVEALRRALQEREELGGTLLPAMALVGAAVRTAWRTWDDCGLITPPPLPAEPDPQYRYCVHCGVDCDPDDPYAPEPVHAAECPAATGVHVVTERDLRCWSCRVTRVGLRCGRCREELRVGDAYAHVTFGTQDVVEDGQDDVTAATLLVCLGCAATDAISPGP